MVLQFLQIKYMMIKSVVSLTHKRNRNALIRYEEARAGHAHDPDTFAIVNKLNAVLASEGTFFML